MATYVERHRKSREEWEAECEERRKAALANQENSIFAKLFPDMKYNEVDGILYPDISVSDEEGHELNKWGEMYADYLEEHHYPIYKAALRHDLLNQRCYEVGNVAQDMYDTVFEKVKKMRDFDTVQKEDFTAAAAIIQEAQSAATEAVLNDVIHDNDMSWCPTFKLRD